MNSRHDTILEEARTALSADDQEELAQLIEAYVTNRTEPLDFTEAELAELKRRHDEPFDRAPEAEVREFFARHRG
jgi:predicted house-cleaning noncanonical NTP pyrophosphatase (MazG superfamily)